MLALSTAWNADKTANGRDIVKDIARLGIRAVELSFSLTETMVKEIFFACREHGMAVTSVHNFCPIPEGLSRLEALPDCFSLSSPDEDERQKAVRYTKISIATAQKLSARAVVLHCGRVEIEDKTRQLIGLAQSNQKNTPAYKEIFENFIRERASDSQKYFDKILKSLKELSAFASDHNILLGIENRFYFREIPFLDEFGIIFDTFKNTGYWHDVGHAYIFEQLGFIKKQELLEKYGARLIGSHLHNIKALEDHQAPIHGDFDFKKLKSSLKNDTIKVIEAHDQATDEDIVKSMDYLERILNP